VTKPKGRKLSVEYKEAPYYRRLPVTGAIGNVSPAGDVIVCNLLFETNALPPEIEIDVPEGAPEGTAIKLPKDSFEKVSLKVIRELQVGLVLTPKHARIIGTWLINLADKLDKAGKGIHLKAERRD